MPFKDPDVRKAYHKVYSKNHYEANAEEYKAKAVESNRKIRKRNRDYIKKITSLMTTEP